MAWRGLRAQAADSSAGVELIREGDAAARKEEYDRAIEHYDKAFGFEALEGERIGRLHESRQRVFTSAQAGPRSR
jgi:hypothetical protein